MESIASKGLRDLVKIFQPLDQELQEIHTKKPFEVKDNLWYSGGVNDPGHFKYLMDGKERCKYLKEQIREAQHRSVDQYNRKHKDIEFKVGDMVYINCRNWKTRRPTPKLDTQFAGPYPVQEWVGCQAYQITLPANLRVHDVFHVSMLKPARTSSLPQQAEQPTIPPLPDEDLDFEVEALIDKHSHNGTTEYKVLWRGYSKEAASWEPVENLNCPDLIQEYEVSEGGRASRQSRERRSQHEPDQSMPRRSSALKRGVVSWA
ncbi:hypothetical protein NDA14_003482 [Ustilago hordei]|nr:hypothetical protein NDA14_003482 [Ustilago hordei]